jgi:hypothetical protein
MTDQTNPPSAGVAAEPLSVEQRLANLYGADIKAPAPQPPQQSDAPEPPVQAEAAEQDADQAELSPDDLPDDPESAAPSPSVDEFEIVHNGTQHKLDRAKTIELAQKGFDYTQKSQALAAQQRAIQETLQRAQEIEQLAPEIANEAAQLRAAEQALQPWQNVDWVRLATDEPLDYARYRAQYDQLVHAYNQVRGNLGAKAQHLQQRKAELGKAIVQQEMQRLTEFLPQLRDPKKFQAEAQSIKEYALDRGYTAEEVESVTDARYVRTLWEASQYRKLVLGKAERNKQLRTAPPTTKPGAVGTTESAADQKTKAIRQNLKKSGDWRDAASLLARMK